MRELAVRLADLDAEAAVAVQVISHFDLMVARRADVRTVVASAAELSGCPVRLSDPTRLVFVRALPDRSAEPPSGDPDPGWPCVSVNRAGDSLWLEATRPVSTLQAVVLERAATAVRAALDHSGGRGMFDHSTALELVLDSRVATADRVSIACRLGLPAKARVVALRDGSARVIAHDAEAPTTMCAGVGCAVPIADLPSSWDGARLALRLTAEGNATDPGPRVVYADELGGLALLVRAVDLDAGPVPDVQTLAHAGATTTWMLTTLDALARADSLRHAARLLNVHHSTLQARLSQAEVALGWPVREPAGRLRLQLALAIRRIQQTTTP
ncbi:helix-turn-helix domain-containing protein [Frankia sp. AgPm24]|uniref:helix-turn-helix domain-containing protein n=1 Tax=Frankia sp. AgPm24 TaxID=631128 RepID=UPI00200C3280|nr:helix-turn-helix domain-containing protein [Frankia sp. AgPm24]MCK9923957.1 helix-turn-helix domain-containing protein [Frankia sp. AgPm24]